MKSAASRLPSTDIHLQSSGLSESRSKNFSCGRMRAKQQSLRPPGGSRGRSRISLPSTMPSQPPCNTTTWSAGDSASRHTIRLPSTVSTRYLSFHCLNMKPPLSQQKQWTNQKLSAKFNDVQKEDKRLRTYKVSGECVGKERREGDIQRKTLPDL